MLLLSLYIIGAGEGSRKEITKFLGGRNNSQVNIFAVNFYSLFILGFPMMHIMLLKVNQRPRERWLLLKFFLLTNSHNLLLNIFKM